MKSFRAILYVWYSELCDTLKDKGVLIFIVFVPLAYPLLYSYVYTNEVVRNVPMAVVNDSHSSLSREFIRRVDAAPDVSVKFHCNNMEEAEELLRRQQVYGIMRIPASFSHDLMHGEQTHVGMYCNMNSMLYYKALVIASTKASLEMNGDIKVERHLHPASTRDEEVARMPVEYDYIAFYNPQSGFASFLIPPVLMLIIQQTLLLGIGMSVGRMREKRTHDVVAFRRSVRPIHVVTGNTLLYFMIYLPMAVYMFVIVNRLFSLPQLGDYGVFIMFIIPYLLACISIAMTLSVLIYRREDCILLFVFMSVPLFFLSGAAWPQCSMPAVWRGVSWLFPSTFGINGYIRISSMGASLGDVATEYTALWMQAAVYSTMACLILQRRVHKKLKTNASLLP